MGIYIPYGRLEELIEFIEQEKNNYNKIVLTGGCFDVRIHQGHRSLFRKSKEFGDILVVNIVNDQRVKFHKGPERPIISAYERARMVSNSELVDYVTIHPNVNKGPTIELALRIKPDVIVQETGKWTHENRKRVRELLGYDVELKSVRRYSGTSTTEIIEKIAESCV